MSSTYGKDMFKGIEIKEDYNGMKCIWLGEDVCRPQDEQRYVKFRVLLGIT